LGVIILGGIVVNNGIVLIDHINGLRREGLSAYDAALEASQNRLRPILMTALTTTLGLMPLALGFSEGAELRAPMAIAVIGGLSSSTLLTLFIVPALYIVAVKMIEGGSKTGDKRGVLLQREEIREPTVDSEEVKSIEEDIIIEETPKNNFQDLELNNRQREALKYLRQRGRLTRQEYIQMFGISVATAARDLKNLQEREIITPEGPNGPGRWYRIK